MRDILFRGKLPDTGEWVEGYVVKGNCTYILTAENVYYMTVSVMGHASVEVLPVKPETVGQYTGLNDKNGKRIFEGDIVRYSLIVRGGLLYQGTLKVVFERGAFCMEETDSGDTHTLRNCATGVELEVIGNIHDNPELLEV